MKHLLLYFYIISFLIFSNCYISNDNITITKPKNIILMIGDGMELSQISAAMYSNCGQLNIQEAKYIGLIKTNSASSIITDSAAGATAFSAGKKHITGLLTWMLTPCH